MAFASTLPARTTAPPSPSLFSWGGNSPTTSPASPANHDPYNIPILSLVTDGAASLLGNGIGAVGGALGGAASAASNLGTGALAAVAACGASLLCSGVGGNAPTQQAAPTVSYAAVTEPSQANLMALNAPTFGQQRQSTGMAMTA